MGDERISGRPFSGAPYVIGLSLSVRFRLSHGMFSGRCAPENEKFTGRPAFWPIQWNALLGGSFFVRYQ
jgi:hypothetical protein